MHEAALDLAVNGWAVFPLRGKLPAISKDLGGRGVLDATTDAAQITAWWTGRYRGCNIGARVPDPLFVLDVDPRHNGHVTLAEHVAEHGPLPETLTVLSGSHPTADTSTTGARQAVERRSG